MNLFYKMYYFLFGKVADQIASAKTFHFYLISGRTKQNGLSITIAYIGYNQLKLMQWASLIMEEPKQQFVGKYPLAGLVKYIQKNFPQCMLLFVEYDLPGIAEVDRSGFSLPYFMQTFIDISAPIEKMIERSRSGFNNTRRLIAKYNLSYEMTKSPVAQLDFYNNMYLPYLSRRYGASFQQVSFEGIFTNHFPHEMILIKKKDEFIAGGVLHFKNTKVYFGFLGIKDRHFENVKKGALSAAYYFLCDELHKRGINELYLGGSPPFVSNQLTAYKIRMTAQIETNYHYNDNELVSLFLLNDSNATRDFLSNSPFVFVNKEGKSTGAVWIANHKKSRDSELMKEVIRVFRLGLDECQIMYWGKKPTLCAAHGMFENKTIRYIKAEKYFDSKLKLKSRKIKLKIPECFKAGFQGFDEAGYLAANPDVAQAIEEGQFNTGKQHYRKFGKTEGRNKFYDLPSR